MTPASTPASPVPATPAPPVARLRDPGELLAALPYLIGFHPRDSLLFIAFGGRSGRRIELTQRVDLPGPGDAAVVCRALAANALRASPAGVAVLVVGGGPPDTGAAGGVATGTGGATGGEPPRGELAAAAAQALTAHGVSVQSRTWAAGTGAGAAWACYDDCGCRGTVPDSGETPFAATAVAAGLVARADRAELEALVAPTTPGRLRRRARMLARAVDTALAPGGSGGAEEVAVEHRAAEQVTVEEVAVEHRAGAAATGHALVDAALADAAAGRLQLDDGRVVALALALSDLEVRDAALARCAAPADGTGLTGPGLDGTGPDGTGPDRRGPAGAEHLWAALARETPDPEAAEPAALLAACALLRGDGALAGIALDRAERAWPGHRLTRLLRAVWAAGIPPERVRECLVAPVPATMPVPRVAGRSKRRRGR